jgi:hypothetical protein
MLHKFLNSIRHVGESSNFGSYYDKLARDGLAGIPTADEAKKDYREFMRSVVRSSTTWS